MAHRSKKKHLKHVRRRQQREQQGETVAQPTNPRETERIEDRVTRADESREKSRSSR